MDTSKIIKKEMNKETKEPKKEVNNEKKEPKDKKPKLTTSRDELQKTLNDLKQDREKLTKRIEAIESIIESCQEKPKVTSVPKKSRKKDA